MTATRKLFVAAALVAGGLGVAKLLGEPAAATRALESAGAFLQNQIARPQGPSQSATAPDPHGGVRLEPDFAATNISRSETKPPLVDVAPPLLSNEIIQSRSVAASDLVRDDAKPVLAPLAPRAKLRNEAPRPLAIESRAPTAFEQASQPASTSAEASSHAPPPGALPPRQVDAHAPANFEQAPVSAPTIVASYNAVPQPAGTTPIGPPPWPMPDEGRGPRKHVVVDGDSLARLAGRYLDDPHRSGEIFEANRGVLTDPDLLPIGVELVVPERTATPLDASSPQSFVPRAVAIHAPAGGKLVPVRPIPATAGAAPQAQLSRPMPVE